MEIGNVTYALPLASVETLHISPKMALLFIYLFIFLGGKQRMSVASIWTRK